MATKVNDVRVYRGTDYYLLSTRLSFPQGG